MPDDLKVAAASDADYAVLIAAIIPGLSIPRHQTAHRVRQFGNIHEDLSVDDRLALFCQHIAIPKLTLASFC